MDVLSILDRYGLLNSNTDVAGNYIKISCPFHKEAVASFSIRIDNGLYHCFGCGEKGTIKKLISKLENCNDLQAMIIMKKYGSFQYQQKIPVKSNKELLLGAEMEYGAISTTNWKEEKDNYMIRQRGFKPKTLDFFGVKNNECSKYFPITMPILDNGIFKGLLKRRIDKSDRSKYMNNKGFSRKKVLGGMYEDGWILVVEGYLDMMMAWQLGHRNVACLFGWRVTPFQIKKLKHFTNKIVSALDNTPLGEEGTKLLERHFKVKRFQYSEENKDIGDFRSKYKFRKCLYDTIGG